MAAIPAILPRQANGSRIGDAFDVNLPVVNRLNLKVGAYRMWIGGHRFATNEHIIHNIRCKLIIDCTPFVPQYPDDKPPPIVGLHDEERPSL